VAVNTSAGTVDRAQSLYAAMLRTPGRPSRARRLRWLASLLAMWGFLAYPINDVLRRGLAAPALAGVLTVMAVFALLWLRTMWMSLATTVPNRQIVPWLVATAVVGVPLAFGLGTLGFDGIFIYLSIASAVSLPLWATLPALLVATGAAGVLMMRIPSQVSAAIVFGQLSYVFWLGAMMLFYRRMMLLVIELRQAREDLARMAVTEERLRIARDLHDLLGHSLSTISLKAQLGRRLAAADPVVAAEIADIESVAGHALTEVREAVTGYRQTSLAAELDSSRAALAAAGIEVSVELEVLGLPAPIDALLGWVLREAVTNVVRHSRARACTVRLSRHLDTVLLRVRDEGPGPGRRASAGGAVVPGNGLTGLGERVQAAGGLLDAGPRPGGGFLLAVTLPLVVTLPLGADVGRPAVSATGPAVSWQVTRPTSPSGGAS
jgi:two-component system, NarL family, sensor histidine kinase DesK